MPSQHEVRWSQLKVGVIVLISTVVLVTLLFLMTSSAGLGILSHKLTIVTYFENSAGLKTGAAEFSKYDWHSEISDNRQFSGTQADPRKSRDEAERKVC